MTGFVFTFSLFCTAVIQADPAVIQSADASVIRQIIDAAVPALRPQMRWSPRRHRSAGAAILLHTQQDDVPSVCHSTVDVPSAAAANSFLRAAHPIRAPEAAVRQ